MGRSVASRDDEVRDGQVGGRPDASGTGVTDADPAGDGPAPLDVNEEPPGRTTRAISGATSWLGSVRALTIAISIIVVWAVSGPVFGFSDSWQLYINTFTTLVTFVMVFIIQNTQNRDGRAVQTKLDDILLALGRADESLMGLEDEPEKRIKQIQAAVRSESDAPSGA